MSYLASKLAPKIYSSFESIVVYAQGADSELVIFFNLVEITFKYFLATTMTITTKFQLIGSIETRFITNIYGSQVTTYTILFHNSFQMI
jgi:hypothetical protein